MFYGIKCKLEGLFLSKRKQPHPSPAVANLVPSISFPNRCCGPRPHPSSLTPQIPPTGCTQPSSQQKDFHSVPLLLMEFSPNVCIHHSQLNLIHFCLNCMTPRRIPLKDSVYSLHSFLKGTYQGLGNMIESIPAHPSLCLPAPSPAPRDSQRPFPFLSAGTRSFRWQWTRAPSTIRSPLDVSAAWGKAGVCVCMCVYSCARGASFPGDGNILKLGSDGCRTLLSTLKGWPSAVPWWSKG